MAEARVATSDSLECCAPLALVKQCSKEDIHKSRLFSMVKLSCTFSGCDQSGFMHPQCFQEMEEYLIKFVKSTPFTNNHKKETFKRYNFDYDHVRDFLWKEKGIYGMIYRQINCNCGKGFLKKDLAWPPSNYRKQRKGNTDVKGTQLPKLQLTPSTGGIRYVPSYVSDYPKLEDVECKETSIPGANFADKNIVIKRGEVIDWNGYRGSIKNLNNPDERHCSFHVSNVQGSISSIDIGCEVDYQTVKKNKKIEAVSVKLIKSAIFTEGVITNWFPSQLSGIINTGVSEVPVTRKNFVPGGFVGDIIGKFVKFKIDINGNHAIHVQVIENEAADMEDFENIQFSVLDVVACPLLASATDFTLDMFEIVEDMTDEEYERNIKSLDPYLLKLAAHPIGYKLVLAIASYSDAELMEHLVRKLSSRFLDLTQTAAGACCIIEILGLIDLELQMVMISNYSDVTNGNLLLGHMIGEHSQLIFQTCIKQLGSPETRHMVSCLMSNITRASLQELSFNRSTMTLIEHCCSVDTESLFLIATALDRLNCILDENFSQLVDQLLLNGGVKVCGIFLHNISGSLKSLLESSYGRHLLSVMIHSFSDLQLHIVLEELFVSNGDAPLVVLLASGWDRSEDILNMLLKRLNDDMIKRVLDKIRDHLELVVQSAVGKNWIKKLSMKVNS